MIDIHCSYDELVDLTDLNPHPQNPNKHSDQQVEILSKIFKRMGIRHPITVSKRSGFIITGHCRMMSAERLGLKQFPVDYQDYKSEEEEKAHLLADNKVAEFSSLDKDLTGEILKSLKDASFDMEATAFKQTEIEKLMSQISNKKEVKPEIEFAEELHESSNYIVLIFDNDLDWLQAQTILKLKTVKSKRREKWHGRQGIGRVLRGADAINRIKEALGDL